MKSDVEKTTSLNRQSHQKSATRRELIQAGRRLLCAEGLYNSRIEDITKHAGIAKGTLYTHFRSKEELVLAVVADGFEELRQYVAAQASGNSDGDAGEVSTVIFMAHMKFFSDYPDLMRILHQVRGLLKFDRPEWRPLRACLHGHLEFLADTLAQGEAKSWSPGRRHALAVFLFGCASGTSSVLTSDDPQASVSAWGLPWGHALGRMAAVEARRLAEPSGADRIPS